MANNNTLFVGKVLHRFQELTSTNEVAKEYLSKSNPSEGTAISAAFQTAGKGQIGSNWEGEAGKNLTLSLILYPEFIAPRNAFELNMAISLSVYDLVSDWLDEPVYIKWPNDIFVATKKIAGILIHNSLSGKTIQSSIVGIGINVNQLQFADYQRPAISMAGLLGNPLELEDLENGLFSRVEQRYIQLRSSRQSQLRKDYLSRLWRLGQEALYERPDGTQFRGQISGINSFGKLIVVHAGGEEEFGNKEIKFLEG